MTPVVYRHPLNNKVVMFQKIQQGQVKTEYTHKLNMYIQGTTRYDNKVRELHGRRATYLIAEYHCGRLQSTPLGKLCTDASA